MNALSRSALALLAARSSSAFSPSATATAAGLAACSSARRQISSTTTTLSATQYLLHYDYIPDVLEKRGPHREGHLDLAKGFIEEGRCLSGGPTGPKDMEVPTGALFIFSDYEAAEAMIANDPYVEHGIVTGHKIVEWNVVVSKED